MKNLPSFEQFLENADFIETVDSQIIEELNSLKTADSFYSVNEGSLLNQVKNTISKFFLGSFSRLNMIDEARGILLDLRIELIEKESEFEEKIADLEKQISSTEVGDKEKIDTLKRKKLLLVKEMESFSKAQNLKIKKTRDVAQKLVDKNSRRHDYLEAGLAEDEIAIAELEYQLAKKRSEDSEKLRELRIEIDLAKKEAQQKSEDLKNETNQDAKTQENEPGDFAVDPEKIKNKIIGKRPKDIIAYRHQLEKDIADRREQLARKIEALEKKIKKDPKGISQRSLEMAKMELIKMTEELDCQINILKRINSLGEDEKEIKKSLDSESELTALSKKINQDIKDGQDEKTGNKKIVSDVFISKGGELKVTAQDIESARKKLSN